MSARAVGRQKIMAGSDVAPEIDLEHGVPVGDLQEGGMARGHAATMTDI
jgi:hypothetical protein